ncbi:hypothetical protein [Mesorhizobium sp.]|uniref:hypothetical protein n=1 Tax=Mesorhizobium sp. TaxID=1871066 RepID=UPI002579606D|nr:hypothetical protein [Mesorhizobium sp.]
MTRYLAVLIFAWPVAASADDACLSKYTKTDVCAFAKKNASRHGAILTDGYQFERHNNHRSGDRAKGCF